MFTPTESFKKLFASDVTPGAISTLAPTRTEPSGDGVFDPRPATHQAGGLNAARLAFVGSNASGKTVTARVTAWFALRDASGVVIEWVPVRLGDFLVTLGSTAGVVGGLGTSLLYATTIAATGTPPAATNTYEILSPSDNGVALLKIDFAGARYVQVQLGTTGTANTANALASGF